MFDRALSLFVMRAQHVFNLRGLILASAFGALPLGLWAEELSFCSDPYPPYTIGSYGIPEGGLNVTLLYEVAALIDGLTVSVELMPWKRCQVEAQQGNLDGILPLFESEDRRSYLAFSDDVFEETSVFWYLQSRFPDDVEWNGDLTRVSDLRLGMLNGGLIDATMEQAFEAGTGILRAPDLQALFLMLEHDRVDLIALDYAVGRYHLRELGKSDRFGVVEPPISSRPSRFGLSKATGADAYLGAFNDAIASLRAEGRIAAIMDGRD